jgi:hypothetical protein
MPITYLPPTYNFITYPPTYLDVLPTYLPTHAPNVLFTCFPTHPPTQLPCPTTNLPN